MYYMPILLSCIYACIHGSVCVKIALFIKAIWPIAIKMVNHIT